MDRATHDADPSAWNTKIKYEYSGNSSTTTLRPHIEKYHLQVYLKMQKEHGWKILLPGLVSQAKSQAASATNSIQNLQEEAHEKFDEPTFLRYLIRFVVANDQVCFLDLVQLTLTNLFEVTECYRMPRV